MSGRKLFASVLMACWLAAGFLALAAGTNAVSARKSSVKSGESARSYVLESKRRGGGTRIFLPIGPSYIYYDYPYYYSRGFYPTRVGPHYIYYGPPPTYGGRCSSWYRRCVAGWAYSGDPGSSRRRKGACRCL